MLWNWCHLWPELIHPFANVIDTELPPVDEMVCVMQNSKPVYVRLPEGKKQVYETYGPYSLEEWHKKQGMFQG